MTYPHAPTIRRAFRGEVALRHVAALSQHHRIQASPGFRAAAGYVAAQLEAAGVQVAIRRYPADGIASFWGWPGFLEWSCEAALLHLLDEEGARGELLCDFAAVPISLIQRSVSVEGEFEVVAAGGKGGDDPADYAGLDVRGKLVLTSRPVHRVAEVAVRRLGAAGILFDGMSAGGRSELDLPDARQYTSFWWPGDTAPDAWGFVLSPRQGRRLRARLAGGQPVRVAAEIRSRFTAGAFEVVEALLPGPPDAGEVLLVSHLCHPQPGSHDNGSGSAALIEAAVTLARLLAEGSLPALRRGIRFLWPPEMTGTYAWLAEHEQEVSQGRWIAGLNLDMVGADQAQTGASWELTGLPQAAAGFADHLLSWLREPFLDGQRHTEPGFSGGSDHTILSDPTVGIPTPMLIQWPDRFYHTSADTPDRVSADALARSGALAATYAYWLAAAGSREASWLGRLMVSRAATRLGREAAATAEAASAAGERAGESGPQAWARYRLASSFIAERAAAGLESLSRLDPGLAAAVPALQAEIAAAAAREGAWLRGALGASGGEAAAANPAGEGAWRAEAERLVPSRLGPAPVDAGHALQMQRPDLLPAYWALGEHTRFGDLEALLQYWADGERSIAAIADLVALETGLRDGEAALAFFKLMAEAGLLGLRSTR